MLVIFIHDVISKSLGTLPLISIWGYPSNCFPDFISEQVFPDFNSVSNVSKLYLLIVILSL